MSDMEAEREGNAERFLLVESVSLVKSRKS